MNKLAKLDVIFDDWFGELDSVCFLIRRSSSDDFGLVVARGGGGGGDLIDCNAEVDADCFVCGLGSLFDCIAWNKHDWIKSCCCLIKSFGVFS